MPTPPSRPTLLSGSTTITAVPGLASANLGGESVVLNPESGHYYGLNEVAARILELVQTPTSLDAVVDALLKEYEVEHSALRTDVETFVTQMSTKGLVWISPPRS